MNKKLLGKRIKELRKNSHFTQENLAELVGIETSTLSGVESGRHFPSLSTLEKIAKCLNAELKTFFDFEHLQSVEVMKSNIINKLDKIDPTTLSLINRLID